MKAILLLGFLALAGCATPLPPQVAITDGIFTDPPKKSESSKVLGGADKKLLIVLSKNTMANVDFLRERQIARKAEFLSNAVIDSHIEVLDPEFPMKAIASSLRSRFGKVQVVAAQNVTQQQDFDSLVIVDFLFRTIDWGVDDVTANVRTVFYDNSFARVGEVGVNKNVRVRHGISSPPGGELFRMNHAVLVDALNEWDRALSQLVVMPVAPVTQAPSASSDACIRSALQVNDSDLRRQAIEVCGK